MPGGRSKKQLRTCCCLMKPQKLAPAVVVRVLIWTVPIGPWQGWSSRMFYGSMGKVKDANTQTENNSFNETAELKKKIDCQAKVINDLHQTVQNLTMKIKPLHSLSRHLRVMITPIFTGLPNNTILKVVSVSLSLSDSSRLMPFQE